MRKPWVSLRSAQLPLEPTDGMGEDLRFKNHGQDLKELGLPPLLGPQS